RVRRRVARRVSRVVGRRARAALPDQQVAHDAAHGTKAVNEHDARIKALIVAGDVDGVRALIADRPELVRARLVGDTRTLLHMATDWPGNFPNVATIIRVLVDAGADVNARVKSDKHRETALHWAASCDDV